MITITERGFDVKALLTSSSLSIEKLLEGREQYFTKDEQRRTIVGITKNFDKEIGEKLSSENLALTRKAALFWIIGDTSNSLYILESVQESREKKLIRALGEYDRGRHQAAYEILNELWKDDKQNPHLTYRLCVSAIRGNIQNADDILKHASSLEETDKMLINALKEEAFGSKQAALKLYEELLQKDPTNRDALFQVACIYDLYGMDEEAIELYEQLRLLRPLNVGVMLNLGINYEDRGEFQKAIECYEAILDYYPNDRRALSYLKDALASLKMYYDEEAIRQQEKQKQLASQSVVDLNLSTRTKNVLTSAAIYSLADLLSKTEEDLIEVENMGAAMLKEIKDLLQTKNLRLYSLKEISPDDYVSSLPLPVQAKPLADLNFTPKTKEFIDQKELVTVSDLLKFTEKKLKEQGAAATVIQEISKKLKDQLNIRLLTG